MENSEYKKNPLRILIAISLILAVVTSYASGPPLSNFVKEKDGLTIYLGVIPAAMLSGIDAQSMHGGKPSEGTYNLHIAIAVFDKKTGRRLTDATTKVRITALGQDTGLQTLEAMRWKDKLVYGNYFSLSVAGPYRIKVRIKTPERDAPVEVSFQYDIAHV